MNYHKNIALRVYISANGSSRLLFPDKASVDSLERDSPHTPSPRPATGEGMGIPTLNHSQIQIIIIHFTLPNIPHIQWINYFVLDTLYFQWINSFVSIPYPTHF